MFVRPRRVLVLRFSSLGDIVLTSAAIDALKRAWPETEIVFATKTAFADLVRSNPNIARVITVEQGEGALSMARKLRAVKADALLDLHRNNRSALMRLLVGGFRYRVVWSKRPLLDGIGVRARWWPYRSATTIAARYHDAVEVLTGSSLAKSEMKLWVSAAHQAEADAALAAAGVTGRFAVLSPGGTAATKLWPVERFAEIAKRLSAAGLPVVITGSKGEGDLAKKVVEAVPGAMDERAGGERGAGARREAEGRPSAIDLTGKFGIGVLGGVIARAAVFVGNDSGPMHMARALGTPSLAVFGSTDPRQFDFSGHAVLFAGVACSPCSFFGRASCPEGHFRCMLDLDVERAWSALTPLIAATRKRALPVHG